MFCNFVWIRKLKFGVIIFLSLKETQLRYYSISGKNGSLFHLIAYLTYNTRQFNGQLQLRM